jgi:undecaprenyl-diphosphatase
VSNLFERRDRSRGLQRVLWDVFYSELRASRTRALGLARTLGIFLLGGAIVAVLGTLAFAWLASHVRAGETQAFDETVLRWVGARHAPWLDVAMVEITILGTGTVVMMVALIAGLFLYLTKHRYSALLLTIATAGGLLLNTVLKLAFSRPRPEIFSWGTHAASSSFPSGHAMSATIIYATVAYLAARLQRPRWARWATMVAAALLILLISLSRVYLGVHYPSDIAAGVIIGFAWAGFCMATLEAVQRIEIRHAPHVVARAEPTPGAIEEAISAEKSDRAVGY